MTKSYRVSKLHRLGVNLLRSALVSFIILWLSVIAVWATHGNHHTLLMMMSFGCLFIITGLSGLLLYLLNDELKEVATKLKSPNIMGDW